MWPGVFFFGFWPGTNHCTGTNIFRANGFDIRCSCFESFPAGANCILLDFNGHVVTGTLWNQMTGVSSMSFNPYVTSTADIAQIHSMISEAFRPFNINVTTSETVFQRYTGTKSQRLVITATQMPAYPQRPASPDGEALLNTFTESGDVPCFVYSKSSGKNDVSVAKYVADAGSHGLGHTLNLRHEGLIFRFSDGNSIWFDYTTGHGNWCPIMGIPYRKTSRSGARENTPMPPTRKIIWLLLRVKLAIGMMITEVA